MPFQEPEKNAVGGRFTLRIDLGNDAMKGVNDVATALEKAAMSLRDGRLSKPIRDLNGNAVGSYSYDAEHSEDEEDELMVFGPSDDDEIDPAAMD